MNKSLLKELPKMDLVLDSRLLQAKAAELGIKKSELKEGARKYIDSLRNQILSGKRDSIPDFDTMAEAIINAAGVQEAYSLRPVINATGVILHTNLGRAPLGNAAAHGAAVAAGYCSLEFDLKSGSRGSRNAHVEKLICRLTGAEAAVVVNNNAAGVFLMLNSLAKGQSVAISRGELVEIGGSFRVPDIMAESGAELFEIGTTNKTKISDYKKAIEEAGVKILLKVHTSNFKIMGFTESVDVDILGDLAREKECMLLYDMGSGFMFDAESLGLNFGEIVTKAVASGADVVTFSGDKLMGSSQAGIICGKKELIDRMRSSSFMRMLRPDKLQLSTLEYALNMYKNIEIAADRIPVVRMFTIKEKELTEKAEGLAAGLESVFSGNSKGNLHFEVIKCEDVPGGGSLPGTWLAGRAVAVKTEGAFTVGELAGALRQAPVPVVARIAEDRLILSVRTLMEGDEKRIEAAFAYALALLTGSTESDDSM